MMIKSHTLTTKQPLHAYNIAFLWLLMASIILFMPQLAHAQIFKAAEDAGRDIFTYSRNILQGLGMLGVLGVGAMAMMGKMPWGWAFALIGGLSVVMLSGGIANWVVGIGQGAPGDFQGVSSATFDATEALFLDSQSLLYIVAGLGTIGLGIASLFGKFRWAWLFALLGGIIIISAARVVVQGFINV